MKIIEKILKTGVPAEPVVLYGPYDAIWPTSGQWGYGWVCLQCGRNDFEFSSHRIAFAAGETHGGVYHPGLELTYTEVHLDPEETG